MVCCEMTVLPWLVGSHVLEGIFSASPVTFRPVSLDFVTLSMSNRISYKRLDCGLSGTPQNVIFLGDRPHLTFSRKFVRTVVNEVWGWAFTSVVLSKSVENGDSYCICIERKISYSRKSQALEL